MTGNGNGLSSTPSGFGGIPNRPVETVSWNDAQVFLAELNAAEQACGPSNRRMAICITDRVAMGIRLPGGNDDSVFVGQYHNGFTCELFRSYSQTADSWPIQSKSWGFLICMETLGSGLVTGINLPTLFQVL